MKHLLNGKFAPLTHSIGFIEKPLGTVVDAYVAWIKRNHKSVESHLVEGDISDLLMHLEPLTIPPRRSLLLATDSPWTAYFDNGSNGPDPFAPVSYMAQVLSCRGLIATCVPNTLKTSTGSAQGTYGAVIFQLFADAPREFLNYERSVSAANDGGGRWRFDANGAVQPFEETSKYAARKIADRFTADMLGRYCDALGIRLFDERFYSRHGLLVVIDCPLPSGGKVISLAEARKQLNLQ